MSADLANEPVPGMPGWVRRKPTTLTVVPVPDDIEPPESHKDLVARVLPHKGES